MDPIRSTQKMGNTTIFYSEMKYLLSVFIEGLQTKTKIIDDKIS